MLGDGISLKYSEFREERRQTTTTVNERRSYIIHEGDRQQQKATRLRIPPQFELQRNALVIVDVHNRELRLRSRARSLAKRLRVKSVGKDSPTPAENAAVIKT